MRDETISLPPVPTARTLAKGGIAGCPITAPNGNVPPGERPSEGFHGDDGLWTWLWPESKKELRFGDSFYPDGSLGSDFDWWADLNTENVRELVIEGRRLDGEAPALKVQNVNAARRDPYGWSSWLIFPNEGCWEVTGRTGGASLTFVTHVEAPTAAPTPVAANVSGCPVTIANGNTAPGEQPSPNYHGNGDIWTGLWPGGTVVFRPGGPGFIDADGSLSMKFWMYWRNVGELSVDGRRLDAVAPPLRASLSEGTPSSWTGDVASRYRFAATGLTFPIEGCWEVTARAGDATLTFVTLVVKL